MTKEDELAARRAVENAPVDDDAGDGKQKTLEQLEAEGTERIAEADDGQMFVWEHSRRVTLGTLIARAIPIKYVWVFGGKRIKGRGGLVGFDTDVPLVVRGLPSRTNIVVTRDEDERVTAATIEMHTAAKEVLNADSEEAIAMLGGIFEARGWTPPQQRAHAA